MVNLKEYLRQLYYNLKALQEQAAQFEEDAPLYLLSQIYDHEQAVDLTLQAYDGELGLEEWAEALEPLLPSLARARISLDLPYQESAAQHLADGVLSGRYPSSAHPLGRLTLSEAKARLAVMPTDELPDLSMMLPPGSRMPFSYNPLFVGREQALLLAAQRLKTDQTVVITGIDGLGKSQLVREVVYRFGLFFAGGVFWLNFSNPANVQAEIGRCGGPDGMNLRPKFEELPLQQQVAQVMAAWRSPRPRLLIFDGCEDQELLHYWRPASGGCRVLATSQIEAWDSSLKVTLLPLEALSRHESLHLVRYNCPHVPVDDPYLNQLAEELKDFPLALYLAGCYLAQASVSPQAYLLNFEGSLSDPPPLPETLQGVHRAFVLNYYLLDQTDTVDNLVLNLVDQMPQLIANGSLAYADLQAALQLSKRDPANARLLSKIVRRLTRLGFAEQAGQTLYFHPVLVNIIKAAESS